MAKIAAESRGARATGRRFVMVGRKDTFASLEGVRFSVGDDADAVGPTLVEAVMEVVGDRSHEPTAIQSHAWSAMAASRGRDLVAVAEVGCTSDHRYPTTPPPHPTTPPPRHLSTPPPHPQRPAAARPWPFSYRSWLAYGRHRRRLHRRRLHRRRLHRRRRRRRRLRS